MLAVLVGLAPYALFPNPQRFVALLAIPALWVGRWFVTRRSSTALAAGRLIPRTPLDSAVILMALLVLVSLYATFDIAFSLPKIAGLVYGIAIFYAVVDVAARSRRFLSLGIGFFLLMEGGLAALALLGTRWPAKFPFLAPFLEQLPTTIRGLPGAEVGFHSNEVAGALLWFIPLALAVCVAALVSGRRKWLVAAASSTALMLMAGTLLLTQSRGGLLGLGVGLLGMLAWLGWWGRGASLVAIGAAVGALMRIGSVRVGDILFGGGESIEAVGTINLVGRVELWSRAIYGIQDFPFTGMGLNAFRRVVHVFYPLFLVSPDRDIGHAHNHLLQAALDLGLPGLIAYLALWLLAVYMLISAWRANSDRWLRAYALGIFGGLLSFFVYGITDTVALGAKPGVAFWILLALAVAVWQQTIRKSVDRVVASPG